MLHEAFGTRSLKNDAFYMLLGAWGLKNHALCDDYGAWGSWGLKNVVFTRVLQHGVDKVSCLHAVWKHGSQKCCVLHGF